MVRRSEFPLSAETRPAMLHLIGTEITVDKVAILALLEAKPGKEKELEEFLKSAQPLAVQEAETTPGTP